MGKVLVIDEEKSSIALFGKALEPLGLDVFVIGTPDKGIEKAIEIEPDLMFVNLIFRESNGLKVSKLLHAVDKLKKVPIVMLINHRSDLDPKYTSTIGVVDVMTRPFTPGDIVSKTKAVLGAGVPSGTEEEFSAIPAASGTRDMDDDMESGAMEFGDTEEEAKESEFILEADRLIDQSIVRPPEGGDRKVFGPGQKQPGDDVIHLRRTGTSRLPGAGEDRSDQISDEESKMDERNLFDEHDETKEDIKRSFEDEFEDAGQDEPLKHDFSDDQDVYDESAVPEKSGMVRKVLIAVGGVILIAGLGVGGYLVTQTYFKGDTAKVPAPPARQVVKETLPPASQVTPAGTVPAAPAPTPDAKAVPQAPVAAVKKEALPAAPAVAPAPAAPQAPVKKEQEKPVAAAKPAEQKPAVKPTPAPAVKGQEKPAPKFAVQAGYFGNEKNAGALAERLKGKGYEAYVVKNEASDKGGTKTFYRVLIGKFDSGKKAAELAREIKQKENLSVVVFRS